MRALLPHTPRRIAVAVSGGADSFALLHMAYLWSKQNDTALYAFTVDHGLRPESAQEAEAVAKWCKQNGIEHETLKWVGAKPKTGIQDAARDKRRELLFDACRKKKIPVLMMAHHADDQTETMLMRLQRGTGLTGFAGIKPVTTDEQTNVFLLRPLLGMRRQELRDYAIEHHLPFIDDPSNENPAFERIALRNLLLPLPDLAVGAAKTAERLNAADEALDYVAEKIFSVHTVIASEHVWLPQEIILDIPDALAQRITECALRQINPKAIIPLLGLENLINNMKEKDFSGKTLADCHIRPKILQKRQGFLIETAPKRRK